MGARSVRRRSTNAAILLLGAAVLAGAPIAAGSSAVDALVPQQVSGPPGAPPSSVSVTLITGDVARVFQRPDGELAITMLPPAGPTGGRSYTGYVDGAGDHHVLPIDVLPLVGDRLDPRLFNVSALVRDGYDDAARAWLPLIVEHADAPFNLPGGSVVRELRSVGASAVRLDRASAADLGVALGRSARSSSFLTGVDKIWLDGRVHASLDESAPQIGAPEAWAAGYDGTGTSIAILDSGIHTDHPDIGDRVVAAEDFMFTGTTDDVLGHGTYTASIAAGTGAASDGRFTGVAYGADLVNAKVLDDSGWGEESAVIAGMEWAAIDQAVDVINISVNGVPTDGSDLMSQAINVLSASEDVLFVVSAGNEGFGGPGSIATPATADAALAVGAVDKSDVIAEFSALGPRIGDFAVKPEIAAPGVEITAARIPGTPFGDPVGEDYLEWSGTSAAAPHVAGAAALVRQARPDLSWSEIKAVLTTSAVDVGASVYAQGGGRVDVPAALTQTVRSVESTANLGVLEYPHDDGETATAEVSLINGGKAEVSLDLAASATNQAGEEAPDAMLSISPELLTLAPGESATATITVDPSTGPIGVFGGYLTASSGGELLHVPLGFEKEAEAYDVTFELADRQGGSDYYGFLGLVELSADRYSDIVTVDGAAGPDPVVLRVPAGTYGATFQSAQGTEETAYEFVSVSNPEFAVDADTTITLDGRDTTEITVDVPEEDPGFLGDGLTTLRGSASDRSGYQIFHEVSGGSYLRLFAAATVEATTGRFQFDSSISLLGTDRSYHLGFPEYDAIPADLAYEVEADDVATVDLAMHADVPGLTYAAMIMVATPTWLFFAALVDIAGGTHHEAWFTAREDVGHLEVIGEKELFAVAELQYFTQPLQPGAAESQRWFAQPARPGVPYGWPIAGRGDEFVAELYLMDADGHFGYLDPGFEAPPVDAARLVLRSGGEVIARSRDLFLGTELPPERATYELVLDTARTADWWQMSTETRTLWRFESEAPSEGEAGPLPLLQIDYGIDLDLVNRAASPAKISFEVYRTGSLPDAEITTFDAWTSVDDGDTWSVLDLTDLGNGSYEGVARVPPACADPCLVSLRVAASDSEGNEIEQVITRAFALTGSGETPTPTVTPTLPPTGTASASGLAVAGIAALLVGGLLVVLAARRRVSGAALR